VTPREQRIWLQVNSNDLRCADGRHWMATEDLGQCVGCGITMASKWDEDGNEYEAPISEDDFLQRCVRVGMYYYWAPPMSLLDGITQAAYFRHYWRPTLDEDWDESPAPATGTGAGQEDPWAAIGQGHQGRPSSSESEDPGDGWPPQSKDRVVGAVIDTVRYFPGNSLPTAATPAICAALGIPADAVGGDIMVTKVVAGPEGFPDIESNLIEAYPDGLSLFEVVLGMEVDIELGGVPVTVAQQLLGQAVNATVVDVDGAWATVTIPAFPLAATAVVNDLLEQAEVVEYSVNVRES
jgi:hypothetical protein